MSTPPHLSNRRWSISNHRSNDHHDDGGRRRSDDDDVDDGQEGADDLLPKPLGHDHPLLSASMSDDDVVKDSGGGSGEGSGVEGSPDQETLSWSTDKFLLSRLPHPPTTILSDLRSYLTSLKHELSELINEDYEEFIGMGIGLRGEGGRLDGVLEGVEDLGNGVLEITTLLTTSHTTLSSLLSTRTELREEKRVVELLIHLDESLGRVEGLLGLRMGGGVGEVEGGGGDGEQEEEFGIDDDDEDERDERDGDKSHLNLSLEIKIQSPKTTATTPPPAPPPDSKLITRIANEYTQLTYLVNQARGEGCLYVDEIEERMKSIRHSLHSSLKSLFLETLRELQSQRLKSTQPILPALGQREEQRQRLRDCLKVYDLVEGWREAEDVVRGLVKEPIAQIITIQSLTIPPEPRVPQTPFPLNAKTPSGQNVKPFSPGLATPITPATAQPNVFETTLSTASSDVTPRLEVKSAHLDETDNPLAALYNRLLSFVETRYLDLLEVADTLKPHRPRADDETPGNVDQGERFEFLANVLWTEIAEKIGAEIGSVVFAAGRVGELHKNYTTTHLFLDALETLAPSIHSVIAMRQHESYSAFERRWQLPVYFQLRWKEIVGNLEEGLMLSSGGLGAEKGKDGFLMPQTAAIVAAVKACWAPSVYIPELSNRFWRMTLQIISRYQSWLEKSVPALYDGSNLNAPPAASSGRNSMNLSRSNTPVQGSPALLSTGDPATDPSAAAAEDNMLRVSTVIVNDVTRLKREIRSLWDEEIKRTIMVGVEESGELELEGTMRRTLQSLEKTAAAPTKQILSILTRRCTEVLKLVRSVASQFRAAPPKNKAEAIVPSHFVPNILRPLKDYFKRGGLGESLKEHNGEQWTRIVLEEVVSSYTNILITVRKTEDLVRRVRKGKKSTFSLFGSSNDQSLTAEEEDERFKKQMLVDVEALGKDAEALGVPVDAEGQEGVPGWVGLKDVITRDVVEHPTN